MIEATVKNDGFEGVLYPASNRYDKVMIVVSGSNGGIKLTKQFAQVYREHGITYHTDTRRFYSLTGTDDYIADIYMGFAIHEAFFLSCDRHNGQGYKNTDVHSEKPDILWRQGRRGRYRG